MNPGSFRLASIQEILGGFCMLKKFIFNEFACFAKLYITEGA